MVVFCNGTQYLNRNEVQILQAEENLYDSTIVP